MGLFLPSNGKSSYGYGGYGLSSYGGVSTALPETKEDLSHGYGMGSGYGGISTFPHPPIASVGGYGGHFGKGSYGSNSKLPPRVSSAMSIDGNTVEVFFSSDLSDNEEYFNPENYAIVPLRGASVEVVSVQRGRENTTGYSSAIVTHSGTTWGGLYSVTVSNVQSVTGNTIIEGTNTTTFCGLRPPTTVKAEANDGKVQLLFNEGVSQGSTELTNYLWSSDYPVEIRTNSVRHISENVLELSVTGMTETEYSLQIGNTPSILFDKNNEPLFEETGTGQAVVVQGSMYITKEQNDPFSLYWADQDGELLPNSSFTATIELDLSTPTIRPYYLTQPIGEIFISDGIQEITWVFKEVNGVGVLEFNSGSFSTQIVCSWREEKKTLTLVRNEAYGLYALMINGVCVLSVDQALIDGVASHQVGVTLDLNPFYRILMLPIHQVVVTASQTIYTMSGNFIHNSVLNIRGHSNAVQEIILTQHGPLTKGWGDATPATKQDVEVYVNDTLVEVQAVNPYEGAIQPTVPIPLMPVGEIDVKIDYKWQKNPIMAFAGLNTEGLTLNKWDRANYLSNATPNAPTIGKENVGRFPFGVVLPFGERTQPKLISHRYIGYQRDYSAVLNSPTTLMLNQDPHRVAIPDLHKRITGELETLDGNTRPEHSWLSPRQFNLSSTLNGNGTFKTTGKGHYYKAVDFNFPKSMVLATRFQVDEYELFGVFTGIGFGVKTNRLLYSIGLLEINEVQHIGFLNNLDKPNLQSSWKVGLEYSVELAAQNLFKISTEEYPQVSSTAVVRFQVFDGSQKGVYAVVSATPLFDGNTIVEFDPPMPEDFELFGNNPVTINFEHLFSDFNQTYRLVINTDTDDVVLSLGGAVSGMALETTSKTEVVRSRDNFEFDEGVFFGSIGDQTEATIDWSMLQYGTTPKFALQHSRGIVVAEHFTELPEDWFVLGSYGKEAIDVDQLILKGLGEYHYNKVEPFFEKPLLSDVDFTFRVDEGSVEVLVDDTCRQILFKNLLIETNPQTGAKFLVNLFEETLNGKHLPKDIGWETEGVFHRRNAVFNYLENIVTPNPIPCDHIYDKVSARKNLNEMPHGLSIEFSIMQANWDVVRKGFELTLHQGDYSLFFKLGENKFSFAGITIPLDHMGEFHTYRFVMDINSSTLSVLVDDALIGAYPLAPLSNNALPSIFFETEHEGALDYLVIHEKPSSTVLRTIGVHREGDKTHINSWELPRTDAHYLPNSSSISLIEEMDWREMMDIRLHRDPTWGVTVYRTDLPPPPYFDGVFSTETTDPSAGWINIEYDDLPSSTHSFGTISFGSDLGYSEWRLFRYRLFLTAVEDLRSPHHMVLNKANVLTSDELHKDITIEHGELESLSNQLVSLVPIDLFAENIFVMIIEDTVIPQSMWEFDRGSQTIFLKQPLGFLNGKPFIGETHEHNGILMEGAYHTQTPHAVLEKREHYIAKISYAPSRELRTKTYLTNQDVMSSVTLLNNSTPPVPKSQIASAIREVVFGSGINVVQDVLNIDPDFYLNDPSKSIQFRNPSDALYEDLEFIEKEMGDDEPIEFACDDFQEIKIRGSGISEEYQVIKQTPQQIGKVFHLSGGLYQGGIIGEVNAVLYPNAPSQVIGSGSIQRQAHLHMSVPYSDRASSMDDGGSCEAELVDYSNLYSHISPWGNMVAMSENSLLCGASASQPTGTPSSGNGFTLSGGTPLPLPTITPITIP